MIDRGSGGDRRTGKSLADSELLRIVAAEITSPAAVLQAYDILYKRGDFQSFDVLINLVDIFLGEEFVDQRQAFTQQNAKTVIIWLNKLLRYVAIHDPLDQDEVRSIRVSNLTEVIETARRTLHMEPDINSIIDYMSLRP